MHFTRRAYDLIRPPAAIRDFFLKKLKACRWCALLLSMPATGGTDRGVCDVSPQIPLVLFWGKWRTFVPKEVPLMIVYGKPIEVQRVENPTDAQVRCCLEPPSAAQHSYLLHQLICPAVI